MAACILTSLFISILLTIFLSLLWITCGSIEWQQLACSLIWALLKLKLNCLYYIQKCCNTYSFGKHGEMTTEECLCWSIFQILTKSLFLSCVYGKEPVEKRFGKVICPCEDHFSQKRPKCTTKYWYFRSNCFTCALVYAFVLVVCCFHGYTVTLSCVMVSCMMRFANTTKVFRFGGFLGRKVVSIY